MKALASCSESTLRRHIREARKWAKVNRDSVVGAAPSSGQPTIRTAERHERHAERCERILRERGIEP